MLAGMPKDLLEDFTETRFTALDSERTVYRRGTGPGVLVMHEIPGITPEVADFARRVSDAGFTVAVPVLFGTPGQELSGGYLAKQMVRACVSREFHVLASDRSSPITDWLRVLARELHAELGGPGVGAIGMCLTGNFALSLMMEPCMLAPVLSQPSLPFGVTAEKRAALHVSPEELANAKARSASGTTILGMRFTNDPMCRAERFERLRNEFGDGFEGIEIDSSRDNRWKLPQSAHSVVTTEFKDTPGHPTGEAMNRVLALFRQRLLPDA
jgi:dienelactone hydrolase